MVNLEADLASALTDGVRLARGDLTAARRWADDAIAGTRGWYLAEALTTRARIAIAHGALEQAERDAHDALACSAGLETYVGVPEMLDIVAGLASIAALRDAMDNKDFDAAWTEGAAMSTQEAIAYAQRGRGERKTPVRRLGISDSDRA